MGVRLEAASGRKVPMRLTAGIDVSPHDCTMLVHCAGVTVRGSREIDGDEAAPTVSEKSTSNAASIRPAPHDLGAIINLPSKSSSGIREVKRGKFAVVQHKAMVVVGSLKARNERVDS